MQNHQQAIEIAYLASCSPDVAYSWLKNNAPSNRREQRATLWSDRKLLEYVLLRRNQPLIDLGLASFGETSKIVQRVYKRSGSAVRCAAWANPNSNNSIWGPAGIWCDEATLRELITHAPTKQLQAFATNPGLSDEVLCNLISREKAFSDLTEKRYIAALVALGNNPRLSAPYDSRSLDGYAEYSYGRVFTTAWQMTLTAPTTELWASVLSHLLRRCRSALGFSEKAGNAIERWRIEPLPKEGEKYYWAGNSPYLRELIANQLPADEKLKSSPDIALRSSFYSRFNPGIFPDWHSWLNVDGENFVNSALNNEALWRSDGLRDTLRSLCWASPDPQSAMNMPNMYNTIEERMQRDHPEWFAEPESAPIATVPPEPTPKADSLRR